MAFDTRANRDCLIKIFPALANDPQFKLTSKDVERYNCIGWAMGFDDRWVEPTPACGFSSGRYVWWPQGVPVSASPDALVQAFEAVGFKLCDNGLYCDLTDKVALYQLNGKWTHATRIIDDNTESSKFGCLWDGYHGRNPFHGTDYGDSYAYMQRPTTERDEWIAKFPLPPGSISANLNKLRMLAAKAGLKI